MATAAADLATRDFFTDHEVLLDPYAYFEAARAGGPAVWMPGRPDVLLVTGFAEGVSVLLNTADFSSFINPEPLAPLPFAVDSDDISEAIATAKPANPALELLVTYDGERHAAARSLLNPLFTPSRLKANEAFMRDYARQIVGEVVGKGACEMIADVATPFVTMVIADLLGVPDLDREEFRKVIDAGPPPGNMDNNDVMQAGHPLIVMGGYFMRYLSERRAAPQDDVMTELALAKYPDGTTPDLIEAVKSAMFLFAAGQDTSAKLLGNSIRFLCERQDIQDELRADPKKIPAFIEEMMRMEGSTKATFRLARRKVMVGDVEVPAGTRVVIALPAANRDPRRWDDPHRFRMDRPRIREHIGFGRGAHTCAGAPLARVEVAVLLEEFLRQTAAMRLNEAEHGPASARHVDYEPSFIIRGLAKLFVEFEAA